jgi:prepilin-type N-terminal cleavage/methylation domain-containing protein
MKTKLKGFTLIELIVVIAVIGLLATIILGALSMAKKKGDDTSRVNALQEIRSALHLFNADKGYYPPTANYQTDLINNKYISQISLSGLKYAAIPLGCTGTACNSYHLGIALDSSDNLVLKSDKDSNNIFEGNSVDCGTVVSSPEKCYDLEP